MGDRSRLFRDDADMDIDAAAYRWEQNKATTWSSVIEDEEGKIIAVNNSDRDRAYRAKKQRITASVRRGIIRYMVLAIDCSEQSYEKDFRPSRIEQSVVSSKAFIREYFDQNPISNLGLIYTRDRAAEKLSDLSANPKSHEHCLDHFLLECNGAAMSSGNNSASNLASLQQIILLSMTLLKHIPNYAHREVLIIYNSLSTCDQLQPNDIFATINEAKNQKLRISVICLAAELYICRKICDDTGGIFGVAIDSTHLTELLSVHTVPPPELQNFEKVESKLIYMGFPERTFDGSSSYGYDGRQVRLFSTSYVCPRCHTRTSDIPTQCAVCLISLNSSSHLARSSHHLYPVPNFVDMEIISDGSSVTMIARPFVTADTKKAHSTTECGDEASTQYASCCYGCLESFSRLTAAFKCPKCSKLYCVDCDLFIHDQLHNCPGCQ